MRLLTFLCILMAAGLAGCAEQAHVHRGGPRYFVPTAAIVQSASRADRPQPNQVLPGSDADYFYPRGERMALGSTSYGEDSYYRISTFDSQAIGIPGTGTYGYRYRWVVQQGVTSP